MKTIIETVYGVDTVKIIFEVTPKSDKVDIKVEFIPRFSNKEGKHFNLGKFDKLDIKRVAMTL